MSRRQFARKLEKPAARNLRLVPHPKRRRRPAWFKRIGRVRKPSWTPELLRFEEDVVYRAVVELGGDASVDTLDKCFPGRFNRKPLWWALLRLANEERLFYTGRLYLPGKGAPLTDDRGAWFTSKKTWFQRHGVQPFRHFYVQKPKKG